MINPRVAAAVMAVRLAGAASRRTGLGGGTALPGQLAERIEPRVVARLARSLGRGRVLVTGTNGKTTTARMIADILTADGRAPVHNRGGSNLMRGLAATLAESAGVDGRVARAAERAGVFEVDEATAPPAAAALRPDVLVFTNLFRDQLDRYGEVDSIAALWRTMFATLPARTTLVLNADDPTVASAATTFRGTIIYFGVEDRAQATGGAGGSDSRWCARCGAEYVYDVTFFWHIGHWRCPGCGDQRPDPGVAAETVTESAQGLRLAVRTPSGALSLELPLNGLYNAYNALAATTATQALGVPLATIDRGLSEFTAAFGRQESFQIEGRTVQVLLCKNPAGVNQVLRTLLAEPDPLRLLFLLNDGIADGRDVSWIWDIDIESLRGRVTLALAGGDRAADMALRLKYARLGVEPELTPAIGPATRQAIAATPPGGRLFVLPTYTAMLQVREQLASLAGQGRFWTQ